MLPRDQAYLVDILKAARFVQGAASGVTYDEFERDQMRYAAIIYHLIIIGEAVKQLSELFCSQHPAIPWRDIARMRDLLIHVYHRVDLREVWEVAQRDIPVLIAQLEPLVPPKETM